MTEINQELLNWFLTLDTKNQVYAKKYGLFSVSRRDIEVFMSDDDIQNFDIAEKYHLDNKGISAPKEISDHYYKYIQAHNHELFHYYQSLTLPAFQIYQRLAKNKLEYEAVTLLKYFEEGCSYILGENKDILDVLRDSNFNIQSDNNNFNELMLLYEFYIEQWNSTYKGISLFNIIEGMAHIFSMQLTNTGNNYLLEMEGDPVYYVAYNSFVSNINDKNIDIGIRIKYLFFIAICHFSCQKYDNIGDSVLNKPSRLFHMLCSKINLYIEKFYSSINTYKKYSELELRKLKKIPIDEKILSRVNKERVVSIFSFLDVLNVINEDSKEVLHTTKNYDLNNSIEPLEIFSELNIDLNSCDQTVLFSIFPEIWADMWMAYDTRQDHKVGDNEFSFNDEIAFYELIENCKKFFDTSRPYFPCCEIHGDVKTVNEVLHCRNEEGLAYYLKQLTGRNAFELFKII